MIRDSKYRLLAKPDSEGGIYQSVLKEDMGWQFLNFQARLMHKGEKWSANTGKRIRHYFTGRKLFGKI